MVFSMAWRRRSSRARFSARSIAAMGVSVALPIGAIGVASSAVASGSTVPSKLTIFALGGQVTNVSSSSHTFTVRVTVSGLNAQKGTSYTIKTSSSTRYVTTKGNKGSFGDLKVGGLAAATRSVAQGTRNAVGVAIGTTSVSGLPRG